MDENKNGDQNKYDMPNISVYNNTEGDEISVMYENI